MTMKRFLLTLAAVFVVLSLSAQVRIDNYPLPQHPDTLRILAVGNSFSDDGTEYLPGLLEAAGIRNVILARLYIGGCTLERHCREYAEGAADYIYYKSTENAWKTVSRNATILDGLKDEPWDIITIQQASDDSGIWETYEQGIPKLVDIIRKEASNPRAAIVWHMTWAYASNSDHRAFPRYGRDQLKMYEAIKHCVDRAGEQFNIPVIIPSGEAVQIARGTRLNNHDQVPATSKVYELTRDGYHLTRQHGRYLAACTWFEALIKPTLGKSVLGNGYRLLDTEYSIPAKDARLCQKCAVKAVKAYR
jgi:hypothetical protein